MWIIRVEERQLVLRKKILLPHNDHVEVFSMSYCAQKLSRSTLIPFSNSLTYPLQMENLFIQKDFKVDCCIFRELLEKVSQARIQKPSYLSR